MTLEKILGFEYSYSEGEVGHAKRRILKEIQHHWEIEAVNDDLRLTIARTDLRNAAGEVYNSFFFHFDANSSLIGKFKDYPEALI